jgi:DNA-binding NtrC family response regulator
MSSASSAFDPALPEYDGACSDGFIDPNVFTDGCGASSWHAGVRAVSVAPVRFRRYSLTATYIGQSTIIGQSTMPRHVLIVDDDPAIRESLPQALAKDGTIVRVAESGTHALASLTPRPDVILLDMRMPDMSGLDLLPILRERVPKADVVLMTAFDDMGTVVSAMRNGAADFLVKPLDLYELRRVLSRIFDDRRTHHRDSPGIVDAIPEAAHTLVGRHPAMIDVYKLLGHLADNRVSALIRGESGTGKELIARAIHRNSRDAAEPFVPVNCTALPETLLESELFGHVRGAFTGAATSRKGRFALAGRGTIFLDEIGDTSLQFQAKLLRVLQEREFYPVGADRAEKTEARVIAATHRDLEAMGERGEFRQDLYYRLRVVEMWIPPLRERLSDLPLLAEHLARRISGSLSRPVPVMSAEALNELMQHRWPGNIRELENCLIRAIVLATGNVIRPEHIAISRRQPISENEELLTLGELERRHIARVLAVTAGHKARTAEVLGISRPRLDRLLAKYALAVPAQTSAQ